MYTTLIRAVPDLVLMLLFYGIRIWLNGLTEAFGIDQIDVDPFVADVITLGSISRAATLTRPASTR